jgi:hypothetical protein
MQAQGRKTKQNRSYVLFFAVQQGANPAMMMQNLDIRVFQTLFNDDRFAAIFKTVDRLHDVVSEGKLSQVSDLSPQEVVGWLKDIVYTVNETIHELEQQEQPATAHPDEGIREALGLG